MNKKVLIPLTLSVALLVAGCSDKSSSGPIDTEALIGQYVDYDNEDYYSDWQDKNFTKIALNDDKSTFDGAGGVVIEGQTIQIRTSGIYVLEGSLSDGQIIVNLEDKGNVRLIMNGVDITSKTNAAINIEQADKTILSLEAGTKNQLTDATSYVYEDEENQEANAALFSKDDLVINGTGTLTVNGQYNDGIVSRDDLIITGGTIDITAKDDGIVGRDLFALVDGTVNITAEGDGVKSSNDKNEERGNIILQSGTLTLNAQGDGIQAEKDILVLDGEYLITAGGGSPESIDSREDFGGGMGGDMGSMPDRGARMNMDFSTMTDEEIEEFVASLDGTNSPIDISADIEGMTIEEIRDYLTKSFESMMPGGNQMPQDGTMPKDFDSSQMPQGGEMPEDFDPSQVPQGGTMPGATDQDSKATPETSEGTEEENTDTTPSQKGLKAGANLMIIGGTLTVDSYDDAVHSDGDVTIQGGSLAISTGDDGVHANDNLFVAGGKTTITKSYEGIEGKNIEISEGTVHINAVDDGVNINGGSTMNEMFGGFNPQATSADTTEEGGKEETEEEKTIEDGQLTISGGYLYVNAAGDGLDSNSNITMTGGTAIVYGPVENMNGALDYDGTFTIEGGTLIAAGSSGMAMGVSDSSTQNTILMTFDEMLEANTAITVTNANGEQVIAITPEKMYQTFLISSPNLELNAEATLSYGGKLLGDAVDGIYTNATQNNPTNSVTYTATTVMTYLNRSGVTEGGSSMMMPGGGGPMGGMQTPPGERGQPQAPQTNDNNRNGETSDTK